MRIQLRIRNCVFQLPVPFPFDVPLMIRMFKANRRDRLVRRAKRVIESDRMSKYCGYNMQVPTLLAEKFWWPNSSWDEPRQQDHISSLEIDKSVSVRHRYAGSFGE